MFKRFGNRGACGSSLIDAQDTDIAQGHFALHLDRTAERIYNTAKLDEKAVTSRLDEPPVMRRDRRVNSSARIVLKAWRVSASSAPIRRE